MSAGVRWAALLLAAALGGCASLIGLEEADVDPSGTTGTEASGTQGSGTESSGTQGSGNGGAGGGGVGGTGTVAETSSGAGEVAPTTAAAPSPLSVRR